MVKEAVRRPREGVVQDKDLGRAQKRVEEALLPCQCRVSGIQEATQAKTCGDIARLCEGVFRATIGDPRHAEKEALYGFLDGLQPWAARELQSQGVKDLAIALAEAEKLDDIKVLGKPKGKDGRQSPPTTDDERSDGESQKRRERRKAGQCTGSPRKRHEGKGRLECFLCNGHHMVRNCPKKALSAMKKKVAKGSDSESV
ncbi:hypothetical protein CsSME_00044090 [Camellia sinensis var. sinensis]